jgi:hypothetical protein
MIGTGRHTPLRIFAACTLLFVAAQAVAFGHSFDHDTGISQSQACATCVAVSHMSAACVDHSPTDCPVSGICHLDFRLAAEPESSEIFAYFQRGPPRHPLTSSTT